jgi:hypothetical protein
MGGTWSFFGRRKKYINNFDRKTRKEESINGM